MKYKLRSSTKNAAESKSAIYSSARTSSTGSAGGPPEKRARLEHGGSGGRSGGSSLRRKPWLSSLISVETQTDCQSQLLHCIGGTESQSVQDVAKKIHYVKKCEYCGAGRRKRHSRKSEEPEIKDNEGLKCNEEKGAIIEDVAQREDKGISHRVSNLPVLAKSNEAQLTIGSLPLEVILHIMQFMDAKSMLCLYRCNRWYFNMLETSNAFWKMICVKEELANYSCISEESSAPENSHKKSDLHDSSVESSSLSTLHEMSSYTKTNADTVSPSSSEDCSEESEDEPESTARGMSGSSLTSYPTSRKRKRRKRTSQNNKLVPTKTELTKKMGFADKPMHGQFADDHYEESEDGRVSWQKVYLKGLQMRRNIVGANFEGWRIYANTQVPVTRLKPDLDLNSEVKQRMMNYPKLSVNDDLKIDWDDHHLVVFHFFRGDGESCTIRVWDIENEPKFLFAVEKGIECITDKVFVVNRHVVIVPSWPLAADAIVMTLAIDEPGSVTEDGAIIEGGQMSEVGKFRFCSNERMATIDENWEHTQLRVVRDMAMVVIRAPNWQCLIVKLPSCELKHNLQFDAIPREFDCQQIRSYKTTAMILFNHKMEESNNQLVTIDVGAPDVSSGSSENSATKLRSIYACNDTVDVALFTDPEEIYLMKRNGDVVIFDPNTNTETIKIPNPSVEGRASPQSEYQLFVNRKEQICVMQSAAEVPHGRNIKVYSYNQELQYTINLDLARYGMSRDESICIYTNGAFLAAADSKKFAIFNVKNGTYLGEIRIPAHLERSKGKDEKFCMFEQTGLSLFIFDEDKLITVHDYERSFPAVLDIYKFW